MSDATRRGAAMLDPSAAFGSLTTVLWDEREAIEQVLFKVVEERLVLETRTRRWLAKADDELRKAISDLRGFEAERDAAVREIAAVHDVSPQCRLSDLAALAPEPWPTVLDDHRLSLRVLVRDLEEAVAATGRLLGASARSVRAALDDLEHERRHDLPLGDDLRAADRMLLVRAADASHQSALRTIADLLQMPLRDFVD